MLEVSLLGPIEVVADGHRRSIGSPAQRTLLVALALRPGSVVSADRLIDLIWEGDPPASAASGLHVYVSRLRKVLGADHLATRPPGYLLEDATTDVAAFEELARSGAVTEALELWRGEPFGDLSDREPFRTEGLRLLHLRETLEERRVEAALDSDPTWAVAEAQALCQAEPLRETRWALLARALARSGRTAEAVRSLTRAREALAEVGLEPSALLAELEDRLLTGSLTVRPTSPSGETGVPPPLMTVPPVGREEEVKALVGLLGTHRLVTLVGPGGVGKTNLARVVAGSEGLGLESRWCELADHEDPAAVAPAVARAVGAPITGRIEDTLVEALRHREMLLVLDNCEHLVSEAARMAERMIEACPDVAILATSREPLNLSAEWVFRVSPLDAGQAAVDLFVQRALAAGAPADVLDRETVEWICRLLDGLPLALEMAAARVPALGVAGLADRLSENLDVLSSGPRTGGQRHRTLEQVVVWSRDLLEPRERLVLQRASIFAGRFRLEAAEEVIGYEPLQPSDVAGLLSSLVDRSLLNAEHTGGDVHYQMLDTVRRVVRRWLSDDERVMMGRHGRYYAELAEELGAGLLGRDEARRAEQILDVLSEMRAAVFRTMERHPELAVRICAALYPVVYHRLRADVAGWAVSVFREAEDLGHPGVPTVGAMAALSALQTGDIATAIDTCRRAREAAPAPEDLQHVAEVAADLATYTGRLEDILQFGTEMVTVARERGDRAGEALALVNVTLGLVYSGDLEAAEDRIGMARRLNEELGSQTIQAWVDYAEGEMYLDRDPARAAELLDRAVATAQMSGNRFVEGAAGLSTASVRARHGEPEMARERFAANIRHWLEMGDWIHQWVTLRNLALLLEDLGDQPGATIILEAVDERERPSYGEEARRLDELRRRLRAGLGEGDYDELARRARRLDDRGVVELALERLGGTITE